MHRYLFIFLILPSCLVSSIHRPGVQINTKGVLKNINDSIDVIPVFSFSASFEDNIHWKRFNVKNDVEENIKSKLLGFLSSYLIEKRCLFSIKRLDTALVKFPDSTLYDLDSINNISSLFSENNHTKKKILVMRFNCNTETHLGYSTLGPAGQTYKRYEITTHALLIENMKAVYHRSNLAALPFVEDFFYRRAISRVLDDAFKK